MKDEPNPDDPRPDANGWYTMESAPRSESPHVLLYTTDHGQIEAWFAKGEWVGYPEGREYNGPSWVCGDDMFQIEVEELPVEEMPGGYHDGTAVAWRPLHPKPVGQ
jgi:hypothetical protein